MSIAPTAELEELFIVEHTDDEGRYCLVYTDATPDGDEAQCDSLEQAAAAIVAAEMKRGEFYSLTICGDKDEAARFNKALRDARRMWASIQLTAGAPALSRRATFYARG